MWLCLTFLKVWCNIICVESAIKTSAYLTYLPVTSYAVSVITERRRICEVWWAAASTAGEVDWKSTAVRDSRLHNTWRPADRWTMDSWSWCHNRHHAPWTTCCRVSLVSSHSRVISVPVCLSVHEHVSGTYVRSSPNFLCMLLWLCPSLVALQYVTSGFMNNVIIFAHNGPCGGMSLNTAATSDVIALSCTGYSTTAAPWQRTRLLWAPSYKVTGHLGWSRQGSITFFIEKWQIKPMAEIGAVQHYVGTQVL